MAVGLESTGKYNSLVRPSKTVSGVVDRTGGRGGEVVAAAIVEFTVETVMQGFPGFGPEQFRVVAGVAGFGGL